MDKRLKFSSIIVILSIIVSVICYFVFGDQETEAAAKKSAVSLKTAAKKEIAMELVSSAENSSLKWKKQYAYIEDIKDGRGYTAGIIGFCSGTGDMLQLVESYTKMKPQNVLKKYLPALKKVNGTASHKGLGKAFEKDWKKAAKDKTFQKAQNNLRDKVYFDPAVKQAKKDGLRTLGQFVYYDAIVMHGPDDGSVPHPESFYGIREAALKHAKTPAKGGNEAKYLEAFFKARVKVMRLEAAHEDISRVTAQRKFLKEKKYDLQTPLKWKMYGTPFVIKKEPK
ncbi:Chitosanase precursor [Listeria grayi]|uniref:Chitosanase n=1 Tax=Listeria grayi TaxID=1641 RepID=A0A378MFU8_LISGR|nr:chitosanase [Listeria grayi]STY45249.1 Chitosanase precursor [Listeria grayi]